MDGYVHSFESFGTVDGPGVRFVIFMQGCILRCAYCHNPDTWDFKGNKYSTDQLVSQVLKYKNYYGKTGGVTLSGGEPLLQLDFVIELSKKLKEQNINVAIDTSGVTYNKELQDKFDELLKYVDLFLLDIKHINNDMHQKLTKKPNINILEFAKYLNEKNKPVWIRHVLVPGITAVDEYLFELKKFIDRLTNVAKVEVLPYHTMGIYKYQKLNIPYPLDGVSAPSKEMVLRAKEILGGK